MGLESALGSIIGSLLNSMNESLDKNTGDEISKIIKQSSLAAGAAGVGVAWLPGVGATAATVVSAGIVISMFVRINQALNLSISESILKGVVSAVGANLAGFLVGTAAGTVLSFIPGIGTAASMAIMGATCYALTVGQAYVYLKILSDVFRAGKNPASLTAEDFKSYADKASKDDDVKNVLNEAKNSYKKE
jgi:uncharacterized protein (DUF697 family)